MNFQEWLDEDEFQENFWKTAGNIAGAVGSGLGRAAGGAWNKYLQHADDVQRRQGPSRRDLYYSDLRSRLGQWQNTQNQAKQDQERGFKTDQEIQAMQQQGQHGEALIQNTVKQHLRGNPKADAKSVLQKFENPAIKQLVANVNLSSQNPVLAPRKQEFMGQLYNAIAGALGIGPAQPAPAMDMSKLSGG